MTLIKWTPINSINRDFDHMLESIFNDGWNTKAFVAWIIAGAFSVATVWHPSLSG